MDQLGEGRLPHLRYLPCDVQFHGSVGSVRVSSEDLTRANAGNGCEAHVKVATATLVDYNLAVTFDVRMREFSRN